MKRQRTRMITTGAFLTALFGVLGIINIYTGSLFDVMLSYIMTVMVAVYTYEYGSQAGLLVTMASFVVLFLVGELFFTVFTSLTLIIGVFYGYCLKNKKRYRFTKYGMIVLSALKNGLIFFVIGSLLGINVMEEGLEIYRSLIGLFPFLKAIINPEISFILLWLMMFFGEAYIIRIYCNLLISKMMKRKPF